MLTSPEREQMFILFFNFHEILLCFIKDSLLCCSSDKIPGPNEFKEGRNSLCLVVLKGQSPSEWEKHENRLQEKEPG